MDGLQCKKFEATLEQLEVLKRKHFITNWHITDELLNETTKINGKYVFLLLYCKYCQPDPNPLLGHGFCKHCVLISVAMMKIEIIFYNLRKGVYMHFVRNCGHNMNTIAKTEPRRLLAARRLFHKYQELLAHNGSDKMYERMIAYSQDLPEMDSEFYGSRYQSHDSVAILEDIHCSWVR